MNSEINKEGVYTELDNEDLKWLEHVRENGKLLEIYDKRENNTYNKSNRIEMYYIQGKIFDDIELTVYIKFENNKIIGFETY